MAETYLTLSHRVINLMELTDDQAAFFERVLGMFRAKAPYWDVSRLIHGMTNPLLKPTGGVVTREVYAHPLYVAVRDMSDRMGIQQGVLGADPGNDFSEDPVADTWLSVADAAAEKGLTVPGLHKAIKRGDVIARPQKPGSTYLEVSRNSLDAYRPSEARQQAGRLSRSSYPTTDE